MRFALTLVCLLALGSRAAAQLPPPLVPPENPLTPEKVILGKILFWDEQLSTDNTVSCGTCHQPAFGGGSPSSVRRAGPDGVFQTPDDVFGAPGIRASDPQNDYLNHPEFGFSRQATGRAAQGNLTAAYTREGFWDGRASSEFVDPETGAVRIAVGGALESQSVEPLVADDEMAHEDRDWDQIRQKLIASRPLALATDLPPDVAAAIQQFPTYRDLFRNAFGGPKINATRIAFALASYQRTLIPDQSPFDLGQLTQQQRDGLQIFNGRGRCDRCHRGPTFSDDRFHAIGLRPPVEDRGRQNVTGNRQDRGRFKTGFLRNVGLRPRYMHNGEFANLRQVINYYDMGGRNNDNQDPQIVPLNLNTQEINALIDFLENGLTDPRVAQEQFPFDRPTLLSERVDDQNIVYGDNSPGSGGLRPRVLSRTPANIGNLDFKFGITNALGGSLALLGVSGTPASDWANGVPLNIDFSGALTRLQRLSGTSGTAGEGFSTRRFVMPDDPALQGVSFYAQWLVADPQATSGICATRGIEFPIF